jgi:MerR family transcriptional regulator/heat shock protein HspR
MQLKKGEPHFTIREVAERLGVHPRTVRYYEREGILISRRDHKGIRIFSQADIDRLKIVQRLREDLGVNLAGAEVILRMRERMEEMELEMDRFIERMRTEIGRELRQYEMRLKKPLVESPRDKTITIPIEEEE